MRRSSAGAAVVAASMIALITGSTAVSFYTQSLFLGPMTAEFGWSTTSYFSAMLVAGLAGALVTPLVGLLADRFGVRRILLAGVTLFALANAALGLIGSSIGVYVAVTALSGVFGVVQSPLLYSKVVARWFDARRGLALAVALSGTGLGGILLPPYTAWLIANFGWRAARFGLAAAVLTVAIPAIFFGIREPAGGSPGGTAAISGTLPPEGSSIRAGLTGRTLWLLVGAFLFSSAAVNAMLAHLVPLLTRQGVSIAVATAALSTIAAAQVAARFFSGWLLDRLQSARIGILWFALAMAGIAAVAHAQSQFAVIAAALLLGLALGAELEMAGVFVSRFFGLRHYGFLYGVVFGAYMVGTAIGPIAVSMIFDRTGRYADAMPLAIGAEAVAAILLLLTGRYRFLPRDRSAAADAP